MIRQAVFDEPSIQQQVLPFEKRYLNLFSVDPMHPFIISPLFENPPPLSFSFDFVLFVVSRLLCTSESRLNQFANYVISTGTILLFSFLLYIQFTYIFQGGEGIILRHKGSLYIHGRSSALVKVKVSIIQKQKQIPTEY